MNHEARSMKHKTENIKCGAFQSGITILLVPLITVSLLAIAIGVFNFVFTQLKISGDLNHSFEASFASGEVLEDALYNERVSNLYSNPGTYTVSGSNSLGSCYVATIVKNASLVTITAVGYIPEVLGSCSSNRTIQRSFQVTY